MNHTHALEIRRTQGYTTSYLSVIDSSFITLRYQLTWPKEITTKYLA